MRIAVGVIVCGMAALLFAQENNVVIKNGADGVPEVQPQALTISVKGDIAEFSIQTDQIQAVRFDPASTVGCNKQAAKFYWILGKVQCSLPAGVTDAQVKLHVLDGHELDANGHSRADTALARLNGASLLPGPGTVQPPRDYQQSITADLTFQAAPAQGAPNPAVTNPGAPGGKVGQTPASQNQPGSSMNWMGWTILVSMFALAGAAWWFVLNPISERLSAIKSFALSHRLEDLDPSGDLAILPERLREIDAKLNSISATVDQLVAGGNGSDELRKIQDLKNSLDSICAALPSIVGIDQKLDDIARNFPQNSAGMAKLDLRFANLEKRLDDLGRAFLLQRESAELAGSPSVATATAIRSASTGSPGMNSQPGVVAQPGAARSAISPELVMEAIGQSQRLQMILNMVPKNYFSTDSGESTANGLDRAISDFFRQASPPKEELQDCYTRVEVLAAQTAQLLQAIDFPELHQKLKPYLKEARQIQAEVEDLLAPRANTMRLRFDVEFYTSTANRDRLIDEIGASLKKQIVKLEKPVEYFVRQFQSLGAGTAQTAADVLDSGVDFTRANQAVQDLLNNLFQAAGVEQIMPKPNDRFQAVEHEAVHTEPRPGGPGRERCVSRLVKRGFRRGNEIIRKAAVVLYE